MITRLSQHITSKNISDMVVERGSPHFRAYVKIVDALMSLSLEDVVEVDSQVDFTGALTTARPSFDRRSPCAVEGTAGHQARRGLTIKSLSDVDALTPQAGGL